MRKLYLGVSLIALFCVLCLCLVLSLYAFGALAAAQVARSTIPIVGGLVGDRVEAWVMGAHENDTIWSAPEFQDSPPYPYPTGRPLPTPSATYVPGQPCDIPAGMPVNGPITQPFHAGHGGVDISVVTGTPVHSTMNGTVIFAGWSSVGYGYLVIVQNGPFTTYYAHNSAIMVSVGQQVQAGQTLSLSGSTGRSTGPHVHYEVRENGVPVDPSLFFGPCDSGIG